MTSDMKAAETFYRTSSAGPRRPSRAPQPYMMFNAGGEIPVAGLMTTPAGMNAPPFWAMYVGVPKLEEAAAHIAARRQRMFAGDRGADGRAHADDEGPAGRGVLHLRAGTRERARGGGGGR